MFRKHEFYRPYKYWIFSVSGGFNGDEFFTGVGIVGATTIAIACAPVTAPALLMSAGAFACGSAAGWFMGEGLNN